MGAAQAIRTSRQRAGLSKRELARRAHTSPAAIVAYESGTREPSLPTLQRILAAAGARADLVVASSALPDVATRARRLVEVLEFAEHFPHRRRPDLLAFPPIRR
jgi:transcriptional regulator with XRE-family HTH domain